MLFYGPHYIFKTLVAVNDMYTDNIERKVFAVQKHAT